MWFSRSCDLVEFEQEQKSVNFDMKRWATRQFQR